MNALTLFWVTDSISERSTGAPPSGPNAVIEPPIYEMSSERFCHHKDTGTAIDEVVFTNHRQSRNSWSPFMALDRSFRTLFVREPAPPEASTVDVEVILQPNRSSIQSLIINFQIAVHTETNVDVSSLHEASRAHSKKGKAKAGSWT